MSFYIDMTDAQIKKVNQYYSRKAPCSLCKKELTGSRLLYAQPGSWLSKNFAGRLKIAMLCAPCHEKFAEAVRKP